MGLPKFQAYDTDILFEKKRLKDHLFLRTSSVPPSILTIEESRRLLETIGSKACEILN